MKAFFYFLLYFFIATFLGALVAFPLYQLADNSSYAFDSWVTRFSLLFLILGMFPLIKWQQLSFKQIGYTQAFRPFLHSASLGFLKGIAILSVVIALLFYLDIRVFEKDASLSAKLLLTALLSGIVVAFIEETLYRGVFYTLAEKWHGAGVAIFISLFFYAIMHFIKPVQLVDPTTLNWLSGFEVIANAYLGLLELHYADLAALMAVGLYLALIRYQKGTLAVCIGLHASWVFLIKITKDLSDNNHASAWQFLTGPYDGIIGFLAAAWLLLVSAYLIYNITRHKS